MKRVIAVAAALALSACATVTPQQTQSVASECEQSARHQLAASAPPERTVAIMAASSEGRTPEEQQALVALAADCRARVMAQIDQQNAAANAASAAAVGAIFGALLGVAVSQPTTYVVVPAHRHW